MQAGWCSCWGSLWQQRRQQQPRAAARLQWQWRAAGAAALTVPRTCCRLSSCWRYADVLARCYNVPSDAWQCTFAACMQRRWDAGATCIMQACQAKMVDVTATG